MCFKDLLSFFVVFVFLGCQGSSKEKDVSESKDYEIFILDNFWQEEIFEENLELKMQEKQDFAGESLEEEFFEVEEKEYPNLPDGFRPYFAKSGFEIGYPDDWLFEATDDDFFVKFFAQEELTKEEMEVLEMPVYFFYVSVRQKPGQELNKKWFYGNFYGGKDLLESDEEPVNIQVVGEEKGEITGLAFYRVYYYVYIPYPTISYYFLSENYLYEVSFFSVKVLPAFLEDEEFADFAKKVISTFKISDVEIGKGEAFSQKKGALSGEVLAFSQNDSKWKCDQLGFCQVNGCGGDTIGNQGCAITSAAMVYNYYSPNYTDPGKLNQCLKEKGGYLEGCKIIWENNCQPFPLPVKFVYSTGSLAKKLADYPVIVQDVCKYQSHFMVATKKSGNDFEILDSLDGAKKLLYASGYCFSQGVVYQGEYKTSTFSCQAGPQNPAQPLVTSLGQEKIFEIDFKNTGNIVWKNETGSPNYIELWSADASGANVDSLLAHPSWISPKIVMSLPDGKIDPNVVQKQVLPGQTARFIFKVKIPDNLPPEKINKELKIYFIPALAGKTDLQKCWDGAHFLIKVQTECQPGNKEEQSCGKCGKKYRECQNGKWSAWSECQGEGECEKGKEQTQPCGNCGSQKRICQENCFWGSWSECFPGGICTPNTQESQACGSDVGECQKGLQWRTCKIDCFWEDWGQCQGVIGPASEVCDLKDNDCNGKVDDLCFKPVYRFYYSKGNDKDHFLKNDSSVPSGYVIENGGNPVFYTYKEKVSGTNPLFRLYSSAIKDHMCTDSEIEKDSAISKGYKEEGNIGYCAKSQMSGTIPLYRCWSEKYSDHHSTTNEAECNNTEGYSYEQTTCYVWP